MSLANKYRPQTWEDVTEQSVVVDILKSTFEKEHIENRNFLFVGSAGCGKAQPLDSLVLTTHGFVKMKDIKIGDKVCTHKGNIAQVVGVFPQGVMPVYKLTLITGESWLVAKNHLNIVDKPYSYMSPAEEREIVLTTEELIEKFNTKNPQEYYRVICPKVKFSEDDRDLDLPIDPYLLGCLVGANRLTKSSTIASKGLFIRRLHGKESEEYFTSELSKYGIELTTRKVEVPLSTTPYEAVVHRLKYKSFTKHKYIFEYKGMTFYGTTEFIQYMRENVFKEEYANGLVNDTKIKTRITNYLKGKDSYKNLPHIEVINSILDKTTITVADTFRDSRTDEQFSLFAYVSNILEFNRIPDEYKYASTRQRIAFLQGVFDQRGTITKSHTGVNLASESLRDEIADMYKSVGCRISKSISPLKTKSDCSKYVMTIYSDYDFPIKRYSDLEVKTNGRKRLVRRKIESIEYVGDMECQCIYVDHPDHSYITDNYIPTHNTTLARICANYANGNDANLVELDAASHSGVDDVREIISQARTYPIGSKYRIYVLDEAHSFSQQAWNAFLLTIEEQPASSIFIFCTTNPEKIPETIISRVQVFRISKISLDGITKRLQYVLDSEIKEGNPITYDMNAVQYIAKLANGGMRDALTLLDKALAYSKDITFDNISKSLELPSYELYFDLLNACAKKDNDSIIRIVDEVYNSGVNFVKWFEGFHSFLMNIVKYISLQDVSRTTIPNVYEPKMVAYTAKHSAVCIRLSVKVVSLLQELKTTQYMQEVALTYLCVS